MERSNKPASLALPRRTSQNETEQPLQTGPPPATDVTIDELDVDPTQRARFLAFLRERDTMPEGSLRPENFIEPTLLGRGSSGSVYRVRHKPTDIIMARKTIPLSARPSERENIMKELSILHQCNSPTIVGFYGAYYCNSEVHVCMEYMDRGSLDKIYRPPVWRIREDVLAAITAALVEGLEYLKNEHKIIHRDIKPSNMLLRTNGEIKLCDFGVSGALVNSMAQSFVGSRSYMSPERLKGEPYTIKSDIWSLGISLVELATGRYPVPKISEAEEREWMIHNSPPNINTGDTNSINLSAFGMIAVIVKGPSPTIPAEFFSVDCKSLIDVCLHKEPEKRADLNMLRQHEFLKNNSSTSNSGFIAKWIETLPTSTQVE